MSDLSVALLADNAKKSFEYSRDNITFTSDERNQWLIRGFKQSAMLNTFVGAKLSGGADGKIIEANTQLEKINDRLKNSLASSSKLNDTLQQIDDSLASLDILIGFIV
jgi:hypothetical protein